MCWIVLVSLFLLEASLCTSTMDSGMHPARTKRWMLECLFSIIVQGVTLRRGATSSTFWIGGLVLFASSMFRFITRCALEVAFKVVVIVGCAESGVFGSAESVLLGAGGTSLIRCWKVWLSAGFPFEEMVNEDLRFQTGKWMGDREWESMKESRTIAVHTSIVLMFGLGIPFLLACSGPQLVSNRSLKGTVGALSILAPLAVLPFMVKVPRDQGWHTWGSILVGHCLKTRVRIMHCISWLIEVIVLVPLTHVLASSCSIGIEASFKTRVVSSWRKAWHILLVCMLFPALESGEAAFVGLALAYVAAAFAILNAAVAIDERARRIFLRFTSPFLDEKDEGNVIVSHLSLVAAFGGPIWLCSMASSIAEDALCDSDVSEMPCNTLYMHSGLITVGLGDTCAALAGCLFGRRYIGQTKKTIEGSLAAILGMTLYALMLVPPSNLEEIFVILIASTVTALVEALYVERDNTVLPVVYMATLCSLSKLLHRW